MLAHRAQPVSRVLVAEKPSVARDIARVLGARTRHEGYFEGNGWRVTWALGHLVRLAEPDEYGADWAARWSFAQLPMLPERWRLRTNARTAAQYRIVKGLLTDAAIEGVVCATDAGREGELIFRLIAEHARCRKPVQRLWVSSLTDEAVRAGLAALRDGRDYDALAAAARARARADWLVGMNLTRAYTVHNRVLCTIGRVQTPTLAMIVTRDAAIAAFAPTPFYELIAHLAEGFDARYLPDPQRRPGETRLDDKAAAEALIEVLRARIAPADLGTVTMVETKPRCNRPPPLYDLTTLQRDANRRYGLTAAKVLELAQALYEQHKLISYPRTESRHIGEDLVPKLPGILRGLAHPLAGEALARLEGGHRLGRAYVDRTKLTDHHAILPTGKVPPDGLSEPLRRIYDLVAARFVAVFLPDQRLEETRVRLDIGGAVFEAKGRRVVDPGWTRADPRAASRAGASGQAGARATGDAPLLPALVQGQAVHVQRLELVERETQPPKPFEDATLLNAMKHAGREIEDEALAAAMKGAGLGTPATRAETIEKLIRSGYLERQRKRLVSTEKGRALIALVAEPLKSAALTAGWEQRLKDIEEGRAEAEAFGRDIAAFVAALIPKVAAGPALSAEQVAAARAARSASGARSGKGGAKPASSRGARRASATTSGPTGARGRRAAPAVPAQAGDRAAQEVGPAATGSARSERGPGTPSNGAARSTAGSDDEAPPAAGERARAQLRESLGACPLTCPKCGRGRLIVGHRGVGCSCWREGCDFVVWLVIAGHCLTETELRALIVQGRTAPIARLRDGRGRSFTAALCLSASGAIEFDVPPDG